MLFTYTKRTFAVFKRYASILVIADHNNEKLNPVTRNTLTAAKKIGGGGGEITILVAGVKVGGAVEALTKAQGVKEILTSESEAFKGFPCEALTLLVLNVQKQLNADYVLGSATTLNKNLIPRAAAKLDCSPISEIIAVKSGDTFIRTIYAGNALQTVQSSDKIKLITVRGTSFEADPLKGGAVNVKAAPDGNYTFDLTHFMKMESAKSDTPDLSTASVVISGGRGLGSKENFQLIYGLAKKLNAGVGASRAACDAGFCTHDLQIGQTGKIVAPQLYIAVGISGAIQHVAGMKDSKTIVAINKDSDAPIFQIADYGVVGDLNTILPELLSKL